MKELTNELLFAKAEEGSDAKIPSKREEDGWYDLYACFEGSQTKIAPGQVKLVPTGVISAFSKRYRATLGERGTNAKSHLVVMAGKIDSGYRGEWFVALLNTYSKPVVISKSHEDFFEDEYCLFVPYKKAICQFDITEVPDMQVIQTSKEAIMGYVSERMEGSLGSSGK